MRATLPEYKKVDSTAFADWIAEWNRLHVALTRHRNEFMSDYLEHVLKEAKEAYYTTGEAIMDDDVYDNFEEKLKILRPDSPLLEAVGYEIITEDDI